MNRTICDLVDELILALPKEDYKTMDILGKIKYKAERMEDRLLAYCNAIEDLGFERIGRDYNRL